MSQLIRLVYASRSTFAPGPQHQGLDPGVARILAKSRRNNAQQQIVGALLFGDGCFLQCLEGEAQAVDTLYGKIEADQRHRDVTVLQRRAITARSFDAWSMKYVPGDQALSSLLHGWGQVRFDPYALSEQRLEAAVQYMQSQHEAAATLPGGLDELPPASVIAELRPSQRARAAPASATRAQPPAVSGRLLAWGAATTAALVLAGLLVLWWRH